MSERKKVGVVATIFAVLFCIFALLFGTVAGVIAAFRHMISPEMMKKYIEDIDLGEIILGDDRETVQTVAEFVYENIPQEVRESLQLALTQTQELMEESYVKEFVYNKVEDFVNDLYNQTGEGKVTPEEITECIRRCDREIYKLTGHEISEEELAIVQDSLEESGVLEKISVDSLREEMPAIGLFFAVISYKTSTILAIIALVMLLVTVLLNRFRIRSLFYIGGTFFLLGGIFLIFSTAANELGRMLREALNFEFSLLGAPITVLRSDFLTGGLSILGIGVVCIVVAVLYILLRKNKIQNRS